MVERGHKVAKMCTTLKIGDNVVVHVSEFDRGKDYTVFEFSEGHRVAGPICFDIFSPDIIRQMTRAGAEVIVNLSNLAWFGKTKATDFMEMAAHWQSVENRIPLLLVSNNGRSVFFNALGEPMSQQLDLYEQDQISETIRIQQHFSIYREHRAWIHAVFALFFLTLLILSTRYGKLFS